MRVNDLVGNYRKFIIDAWPSMLEAMGVVDLNDYPYLMDDWFQANWEIFVEKPALGDKGYLSAYGYEGKGRYGCQGGDREYKMVCRKKNEGMEFDFKGFVSRVGEEINIEPPFDFVDVMGVDGIMATLKYQDVDFLIVTA